MQRYLYSLAFVWSISELVHFSQSNLDNLGHNIGHKYLMASHTLQYFVLEG